MSPAAASAIRVLIVEDEPKIAAAHRSYVERVPGFTVVAAAHTGRDAISIAKRSQSSGVPVDLVLMDIGLPDMSGLAVAAAMAVLRPRPDVIAVTSARDLAMVRSAVSHGVVLYLLKPFTFAAFREKLDRYVEYRAALPAGETAISQQDIDRAFGVLRTPDQRPTSPKGIAPQTMDEVSRAVRAAPDGLSAGEAGRAVGVSRVTAWRYLERMAEAGMVERRTDYGRTGRPQVRYVWLR
ncbi:response regulator [Nocardia sp. CT2-14]|uniref:Transcriptional regulatory protein n=2 Tax=Nocardia aurantiaca TaxID=2675850 RepID=A0A6I3KYW1_9NOCA|nr:response regulator [Nocardia aurantiaca]